MRVAVVGAGISGLTVAVSLLRAGHEVRVVAAEPAERSTSALAAAVWFPTYAGPPDLVARWGARTLRVLAEQAAAGVPGVVLRESLVLGREPLGEPDWVPAVGAVRPAEPHELPPGYGHGLRFAVPLVEMPVHLPWLAARVAELGGSFDARRLTGLGEVTGVDVVVNCSGLGARELVGDDAVFPVRGQVVRVRNPGLTTSVRDEHHPGGRAYVHPRADDCILGGTLEPNEWDTEPDLAVSAAILRRCADIVPALRDPEVLEHVTGLRPARPTVRLEESEPIGSMRVIHDYGHGGSGITLSWGCAEDVVALVDAGKLDSLN